MPSCDGTEAHLEEAARLVNSAGFLSGEIAGPKMEFAGEREFTFASPLPSPYEENNVVFGRFYRAGADWRRRPAVILAHGWNDVPNHYYRFPTLARKLNESGINAMTFELPYHFKRRPRQRLGAASNFLSADVLRTSRAVEQAVAEIRAMTAWLAEEGCPRIGALGVSLGGWIAGLAGCHEPRLDAMLLIVPVVRLDRIIDEAAFCQTLRAALKGQALDLGKLNLLASRPMMPIESVALVASRHDLFVPWETVQELRERWGQPEFWRYNVGHVSVLGVPGLTRRVAAWFAKKLGEPGATQTGSCQDNSANEGRRPLSGPRASS